MCAYAQQVMLAECQAGLESSTLSVKPADDMPMALRKCERQSQGSWGKIQ
jgi:hypothetical protein